MKTFSLVFLVILVVLIIAAVVHREQLKIWLLNVVLIERGVLAVNCFWYRISDMVLGDAAGVDLYNTYKKKYGDFPPTYQFNEKTYLVTNNKHVRTILDNSPDLFSVGILKQKFFKSFMAKNVGVSSGCPWKKRRHINEMALVTDRLHTYASKYNNDIVEQLLKWKDKSGIRFKDFFKLSKIMTAKIVFNANRVSDDVFKIFSEANSIEAFFNPNFEVDPEVYDKYLNILKSYVDNPNRGSLIELCMMATNNKEEVLQQIPHFIFPIVGLFITTVPRLLLLLCNHRDVFQKVIQEVYSVNDSDIDNYEQIYELNFLRKCVLETLRLNNPVITTFRTVTEDYTFDNKHSFKKGTQFLILNNPVLREKEYFSDPNKFMPSRWTPEMEKSYYAISFNQGPQRCPGKELAIYLVQSFVYNLIKIKKIGKTCNITSDKINTQDIPQIINPCPVRFKFVPL